MMMFVLFAATVAAETCSKLAIQTDVPVALSSAAGPSLVRIMAPAGVAVVVDQSMYETSNWTYGSSDALLQLRLFTNAACAEATSATLFVTASNTSGVHVIEWLPSSGSTFDAASCDTVNAAPVGFEVVPFCTSGGGGGGRFLTTLTPPTLPLTPSIISNETPTSSAPSVSQAAALATTAIASALIARNAVAAPLLGALLSGCGVQGQTSCDAVISARLLVKADRIGCGAEALRVQVGMADEDTFTQLTRRTIYPPGRPFVNSKSSAAVLAEATASTDDERAARWVSQGLGEHASVASFAAFSLQLMINGAPFPLLAGAANANGDEVRHAEQSFALASRFAGHRITAEPFPRHAVSSMAPESLEELAEATFRQGCIAETLSVFAAARQVDDNNDVVDEEEREVLVGIVRDEARHSALAWRTVAWATGTARNASLNERLMQIATEESKRCVAQNCAVFERLIMPLSGKLIGMSDWQRVVESEDVPVGAGGQSFQQNAIASLLSTFA
jgi:hypothetical protein